MYFQPYAGIGRVREMSVRSDSFTDGGLLAPAQLSKIMSIPGGADVSPHLEWSGFPLKTRSFAVTAYCPDMPTGSGFWHWALIDIPHHVTSLAADTGRIDGSGTPAGSMTLPNDLRLRGYLGAAPDTTPSGAFGYMFVVYALDVRSLKLDAGSTPARFGMWASDHIIARGQMIGFAEVGAESSRGAFGGIQSAAFVSGA